MSVEKQTPDTSDTIEGLKAKLGGPNMNAEIPWSFRFRLYEIVQAAMCGLSGDNAGLQATLYEIIEKERQRREAARKAGLA